MDERQRRCKGSRPRFTIWRLVVYRVIGSADYYAKTVGAVLIEGSQPDIYDGLIF